MRLVRKKERERKTQEEKTWTKVGFKPRIEHSMHDRLTAD